MVRVPKLHGSHVEHRVHLPHPQDLPQRHLQEVRTNNLFIMLIKMQGVLLHHVHRSRQSGHVPVRYDDQNGRETLRKVSYWRNGKFKSEHD